MKTKNEKIEDFLNSLNTEIDILNCIDIDNVHDYDTLYYEVENGGGFDIDVIYYSNAMKYLTEHDTSLNESLEIASEYGYECQNLNSEVLASLLASQNCRNEFSELEGEITEFFEERGEEEEEEEEII